MTKKGDNRKELPSTLPEIIKIKFKKEAEFEELDSLQQGEILEYIENKNLQLRVFGKRGFDILALKFFAYEYKLENGRSSPTIIKNEYEAFEDYYNNLKGDIYRQSCYYGYKFSDKDIDKYSLVVENLNFDSFIDDDISMYTFESFEKQEKEKNEKRVKNGQRLQEWALKADKINTYDELLEKLKYFNKNILWNTKHVFFAILMQKYGQPMFDLFLRYACSHNSFNDSDGIAMTDILFYYGAEAAQTVIDNYKDDTVSERTRKKDVRCMRERISKFQAKETICNKVGKFDFDLQLYCVKYLFYAGDEEYPFMRVKKYFVSFDDFANELGGNLCGCDLSKSSLTQAEISKYKTDEYTQLPAIKYCSSYQVVKEYVNGEFVVTQYWFDAQKSTIFENKKTFGFFCDFVHYLKKDLSDADLLLCDNIFNISEIKDLNLNRLHVRSGAAEKLNLELNLIPDDKYKAVDFTESKNYELATENAFMLERPQNEEYIDNISYITDIHLFHRYEAWKCRTTDDMIYVTKVIANEFANDKPAIQLIGGDIASDSTWYRIFINILREATKYKRVFVTLGNHELWAFPNLDLNAIVKRYRAFLARNDMRLVHNNLYYIENGTTKEITTSELENIDETSLRQKVRSASLIIFGGIGFSGKNQEFNAIQGIYRKTLSRDREIAESIKFDTLYKKVARALYGKNVIILTHMPMKDWSSDNVVAKGFVYVNGHNHRNYYFDDGITRIYADNQIGYKQKYVRMKHLSISMQYDWFSDYKDGIYEINRNDYINFYRGIEEYIDFNREFRQLYMLKRDGAYMFLMVSPKGNLQVLNGGMIRSAGKHQKEYFYDNLSRYAQSVKMFLSQYNAYQAKIAKAVKSIGGEGRIHGCIVDIDFFNHIYVNPLDETITPYFAYSITDKYVYKNIPSLLANECPSLYANYESKYRDDKNILALVPVEDNFNITDETIEVEDTGMYRVSRIIKSLQYTTKYSVVRRWNDSFTCNISKENGKLIVGEIINLEKLENRNE